MFLEGRGIARQYIIRVLHSYKVHIICQALCNYVYCPNSMADGYIVISIFRLREITQRAQVHTASKT